VRVARLMMGPASGRLADARIAVTGAATGIGRAVAERCVAEGGRVAVLDIDHAAARHVAGEIGVELALGVDVADSAAVTAAIAEVAHALGGLDRVVNNAGIPMVGAAHELAEVDWDRVMGVNLKSIYLVSRAAWPHMRDAGGGAIASTASVAGIWGTQGQAGYAVTKAAVIMLTRCMALDGARDGIRVNCVSPGFTRTPLLERYLDGQPDPAAAHATVSALHPLGRLGEPLDIADAFVYLLSNEARWVTGTNLVVDGGLTAGIWG
jgi:NAD(P)-dependent dehydrogenase (short-subunit alcohol dehydrogenase family)